MSKQWVNPSRSAVVFDRANNRTIQPGERTDIRPHQQLLAHGKLIEVDSQDLPSQQAGHPVHLVSALEINDTPLVIADDEEEVVYVTKPSKKYK